MENLLHMCIKVMLMQIGYFTTDKSTAALVIVNTVLMMELA